MNKIDQIKEAIEKAKRHESKLSPEALAVPSLTSLKIRHLLNNLGAVSKSFLEIGSHRGGTYVSTVYNNNLNSAIAIDNYCESFHDGDARLDFIDNANRFSPEGLHWRQWPKDSFSINTNEFPEKIDLYLYDGDHSAIGQEQALTHFMSAMQSEFIFLVDDYSWEKVRVGTMNGIEKTGVQILFQEIFETMEGEQPNEAWHNGYAVFYLKQTK